jgi:hypothetical protein
LSWGSGFVILDIIVVDHDFLRVRNRWRNRSQWLPSGARKASIVDDCRLKTNM